jgi:hypothetical protein
MSNESENRIDLTQFEGIKEWEVEKRPDGGYAIKTGRDNFSLEEAETLAKLPNLIAELKKCYEKLDWLQQTADLAADYIGEIHHSNWDNFTERMYEAGLWKRPSEEE